jgi:hypothetical protein
VEANLDRFTPDALVAALVAAGYDQETAQGAARRAAASRDLAPTRASARRVVYVAYGLTYLVFLVGLLGGPNTYGMGQIGAVVLTFVVGIALAISVAWITRRRGTTAFATMLSVPLVLLLIVGGACYASTGAPVLWLRQVVGVAT